MHMIPAHERVNEKLHDLRAGDLIQAHGYLVDVDHESGFYWRTSTRRDDTGGGSCEIFYVEQIYVEPR